MSRFRRRLMGLAQLREAKRKDFVRVEYIENTSNAYIDTKVFPNNNTKVEIRGTISTVKQYLFGVRTAAYNRAFGFYGIDNTNKARWDYGNKLANGDFALDVNVIYQISNNKNVITVYNESTETSNSITATNNTFTCQYTMYYFGVNQKNVLAATTKGKLYYLKIYDGETLVRDYIPMYQISKDTYGLWDKVENKFYTSPNGVKFTGGREIIYDAEIEYLESTGTQYIQLDCNVTKTNKFTVGGVVIPIYTSDRGDYAVFGANPWKQCIGAFYSKNNNNFITYSSIFGGLGAAGGVGGGWGGTVGTEVSFELSTTEKVINGVHTSISRPLQNAITAFRIFGGYRDNHRYPIKIKSFYIKKDNAILYDFIPVRIGNVGYLYDKVSNKLFGNDGTGTFILGQDTIVYDKI